MEGTGTVRVGVVNVRGLRTPVERAGVVYVGRGFAGWKGHPLANPFKIPHFAAGGASQREVQARLAAARADVLARYRGWLLARPTLSADLAALRDQTDGGRLPLGCWCHPLPCHADILAGLLDG